MRAASFETKAEIARRKRKVSSWSMLRERAGAVPTQIRSNGTKMRKVAAAASPEIRTEASGLPDERRTC